MITERDIAQKRGKKEGILLWIWAMHGKLKAYDTGGNFACYGFSHTKNQSKVSAEKDKCLPCHQEKSSSASSWRFPNKQRTAGLLSFLGASSHLSAATSENTRQVMHLRSLADAWSVEMINEEVKPRQCVGAAEALAWWF
jgi:hypothetical protein